MWPLTLLLGAVLFGALGSPPPANAQTRDVLVFAAASMKDALDAVADDWERASGSKVVISYAASSALARQIEAGAPAQVFMSADLDWMDYLDRKKLIRTDTRVNLLGNRIVLVAPKGGPQSVEIKPGFDLVKHLAGGRLSMANVTSVPAGRYGKAALEALGVWPGVSSMIAEAENVRAALLLVSRGEAPLGIVYKTDAAADPSVEIVGTFPSDTHPPIIYPIALTADQTGSKAKEFLAFVRSSRARTIFENHGFIFAPGERR